VERIAGTALRRGGWRGFPTDSPDFEMMAFVELPMDPCGAMFDGWGLPVDYPEAPSLVLNPTPMKKKQGIPLIALAGSLSTTA